MELTAKSFRQSLVVTMKMLDEHVDDSATSHIFWGRHYGFKGRPYRRGANRCKYCGAPRDFPDNKEQQKRDRAADIAKTKAYMSANIFNAAFAT